MAKVTKNRGGRPTAYKEEFCELAFNYALLGATDVEMAVFFGVSEKTLNTWKSKHPEFLQSLKAGKEEADGKVARSLYQKAVGYVCKDTKFATHEGHITDSKEYDKHHAPDTTAAIFWLKNRQPEKFRDKREVEVTGKGIGSLIDEIQDEG